MKNNNKKTNNLLRRDFIKNSSALSAGAMILPHHILKGEATNLTKVKVNKGSAGTEDQTDNKKWPSFLNKPYPVIAGIFGGQTPEALIEEVRNFEFEGAGGNLLYN